MRKIIGWSVDWVIELTEYLLAYLTFLGGAHLLKIDGHLTFDLVVQRLRKKKEISSCGFKCRRFCGGIHDNLVWNGSHN